MSKRGLQLYLEDILGAIANIENYCANISFENFINDKKTIDAAVRNLEIIGEAANHIPQEVRDTYSQVPWEKMVSMRNKVMHEYFGVDVEILWETITEDLPILKQQIQIIPKTEQK